MPDRLQLEQAIVVLEAQRPVLGNDVVELSLASLRHKLGMLEPQTQVAQYESVTVLVADLSGYTAMSEQMDAEEVRDTINAIWEKLDGVVLAWGGRIDKHIGDGLIALFGLPNPHADDRERAIMAALDMQMELALLNRRSQRLQSSRPSSHAMLHMRIGIDVGPVVFGRVGIDGQDTAMGDAVRFASQLQQLAPTEGTLISYDIYSQVHAAFEIEPLAPVALDGKTSRLGVYVVKGEATSGFDVRRGAAPGFSDVRLVGRHPELEQLQYALQTTIESGTAQFVTMVGEAGVGKSRLIHEFERLLRLSPVRMSPLIGSAERHSSESPYALWRGLFRNRFNIHTPSSAAVAMERFAVGISNSMPRASNSAILAADRLGQLLGFGQSHAVNAPESAVESQGTNDLAFQDIVDFFKAISTTTPVTLVILDDVQWADEKSLDLLDHLLRSCQDIPLMILCSGRPALFQRRPAWRSLDSVYGSAYLPMELAPLSSIDSHHLIGELLKNSAQIPLKLVDLVVERTGGNPAYIEELTNILIESGIVFKEGNQWRAQIQKMEGSQMLPSLTNLLQARLEQLPHVEHEIVKTAAVFGRIFWKSAVIQTIQAKGTVAANEEIERAIASLEQQDLIYRHKMPGLVGVDEYVFRYNRLRNLAYQSITPAELAFNHAQAASWLIANSGSHLAEYAGIIATHFEGAEQPELAAEWYGRAGAYAKEVYAIETGIQQYRRALELLPDELDSAQYRVELYEELAGLLRWRARFTETIDAYESMLAAARNAGDEQAEVRALLGTYLTQEFQGDHAAALDTSQLAEDRARSTGSPSLLAAAMAARAWSLARVEEVDTALDIARELLTISAEAAAPDEIALSNALIGSICRIQRWYDQAHKSTEKALNLYRQQGNREWEELTLGNLGHIAYARRDYPAARTFYLESLRIARDLGESYGTMRCLRKLASICRLENQDEQALRYYQEAFILADKSGNAGYCAYVALDIGAHHLAKAAGDFHRNTDFDKDVHMQQTRAWLERALRFGRDQAIPVTTALAKTAMARLMLMEERRDEALSYAKESLAVLVKLAQSHTDRSVQEATGIAWRTLGLVAIESHDRELPAKSGDLRHDPAACFNQSLRAFAKTQHSSEAERAHTLYAWARYELNEGDEDKGSLLWQRAASLFARLGMEANVAWMKQLSDQ